MTKECTVSLAQIEGANFDLQPSSSGDGNVTMRLTGRKCTIPDYSKLLNYDDELDIDRSLPPSPVK